MPTPSLHTLPSEIIEMTEPYSRGPQMLAQSLQALIGEVCVRTAQDNPYNDVTTSSKSSQFEGFSAARLECWYVGHRSQGIGGASKQVAHRIAWATGGNSATHDSIVSRTSRVAATFADTCKPPQTLRISLLLMDKARAHLYKTSNTSNV